MSNDSKIKTGPGPSTDWNAAFRDAHLGVWPQGSPVTLCISNRNPNPENETARNVFREDEADIMEAASNNGFKMLGTRKDRAVSFIKVVSLILSSMLLAFSSQGATATNSRISLTITVTNVTVTGYSNVINSSTRIFTNAQGSTTILTNLVNKNGAATNLFNNYASFPIGSGITHRMTDTNVVVFTAPIGVALSGTVIGPWATAVLSTQAGPATLTALWPLENVVGDTNRTNQGSSLVYGLSTYSTNAFATNATAVSNFITKGASVGPQYIITELRISGNINNGTGNLSVSNLVNSGNALRSSGSGGNSFQVGSNALANGALSVAVGNNATADGLRAVAVGNSAFATNTDALAVGTSATASTNGAVALGNFAIASGYYATALGNGAEAGYTATAVGNEALANGVQSSAVGNGAAAPYDRGSAFGYNASAGHSNSTAIGQSSATTSTNQIRLGTASETVSIPGVLAVTGTITNATLRGTNIINGQTVYTPTANTSLANGYNSSVAVDAAYIKFSGPSAAYTNVGFSAANVMAGKRHLCQFDNPGLSLTILHDSGLDAGDTNRIYTGTGALINSTNNPAFLDIIYDAAVSRWRVISFR